MAQLRFSPDGNHLAALVPIERRMNLVVIDLSNLKQQLVTKLVDEEIETFRWANNERLLFQMDEGGRENYGLYAVSRKGGVIDRLAYSGERGSTARINERFGGLLRRYRKDPHKYMVRVYERIRDRPDVGVMDVRSGATRVIARNPGMVESWIIDRDDVVRLGVTVEGPRVSMLYRDSSGAPWETIAAFEGDEPQWTPLGFDGDNRTLFVSSSIGRATRAIYRFDTQTRTMGELVAGDEVYDIDGELVWSEALKAVVGVRYDAEKEVSVYWNEVFRRRQEIIDRSLPGYCNVQIESTDDGSKIVIFSYSDREPGVYYLFDDKRKRIEELAAVKPKVDPERMSEMRPVTYRARDGLPIHGYLTVPVGLEPRNLPLVLHPHGGPYGVRDTWGFNPEVQFLASRGFAVLQVNYRGSGGYGFEFESLGFMKWGLEMQDDLTDGVRWAIEQGIADPKRVVISGASYGGYAAMAGAAFTPELYCAAINYVGVTDLPSHFDRYKDRSPEIRWWVKTRIGDISKSEVSDRLRETSPARFAERIRVPILMAYGRNDPRVKIDQGHKMESALKRAGVAHKFLIERDEGHGFGKEENRIAWYLEIEAFLEENVPAGGN